MNTSALPIQSPIHCASPPPLDSVGLVRVRLGRGRDPCACRCGQRGCCPQVLVCRGLLVVHPLFFSCCIPSLLFAMLSSLSLLRRAAPSLRRAASSSPTAYTYARHGHPSTVISSSTEPASGAPSADQVAVSFLAAGVDAGDVAAVLGVDGAAGKAPFPRVAGHGGVGLVTKVGSSVTGLKEGDYVVPAKVRACHSWGAGC